ncbi:uncharacterized protein LOC143918931 isoform X1 [Arctopsyche grandis]|uniref:uncharacterized protein LOC143918931 isoform X1 n=1 Tax=Arctopsyche grandis TaxID=121162 RepID=UPI00406D9C20
MKAFALLFVLMILTIAEAQYAQISTSGSGLYFDPLGRVKISTQPLDVVTYVNISYVQPTLESMNTMLEQAKVLSLKIEMYEKTSSFSAPRGSLDMLMSSCESQLTSLELSTSVKRTSSKSTGASERDLRNLQSAVSKLRSDEKETIVFNNEVIGIRPKTNTVEEDMKTMRRNQDIVEESLRNLSKVIEEKVSQLDKFKIQEFERQLSSVGSIRNNLVFKEYGETLDLNKETLGLQTLIDNSDVRTKMNTWMESIRGNLQLISDTLRDVLISINFAKKDILHTAVISHQRIYDELSKNIYDVSQNSELPYPPKLEYIQSLMDLSKVISFVEDGIIVFVLRIPLVKKNEFILYKYLPMPIAEDPSKPDLFLFIQPDPKHSHLAMSTDKLSYTYVDSIKDCKTLSKDKYLCESETIASTGFLPTCETKLLTEYTPAIPEECDVRVIYGSLNVWHKISNRRWIYVLTATNRMTMDCHGKDPTEENVMGSGILTIPDDCSAHTNSLQLDSSTSGDGTLPIPKSYLNIWNDICCTSEKFAKIKDTVKPARLLKADLIDLKDSSYEVNQIKSNNLTVYICSALVVGVVLILLIILAIYKFRSYLKCNRCTFNQEAESNEAENGQSGPFEKRKATTYNYVPNESNDLGAIQLYPEKSNSPKAGVEKKHYENTNKSKKAVEMEQTKDGIKFRQVETSDQRTVLKKQTILNRLSFKRNRPMAQFSSGPGLSKTNQMKVFDSNDSLNI